TITATRNSAMRVRKRLGVLIVYSLSRPRRRPDEGAVQCRGRAANSRIWAGSWRLALPRLELKGSRRFPQRSLLTVDDADIDPVGRPFLAGIAERAHIHAGAADALLDQVRAYGQRARQRQPPRLAGGHALAAGIGKQLYTQRLIVLQAPGDGLQALAGGLVHLCLIEAEGQPCDA